MSTSAGQRGLQPDAVTRRERGVLQTQDAPGADPRRKHGGAASRRLVTRQGNLEHVRAGGSRHHGADDARRRTAQRVRARRPQPRGARIQPGDHVRGQHVDGASSIQAGRIPRDDRVVRRTADHHQRDVARRHFGLEGHQRRDRAAQRLWSGAEKARTAAAPARAPLDRRSIAAGRPRTRTGPGRSVPRPGATAPAPPLPTIRRRLPRGRPARRRSRRRRQTRRPCRRGRCRSDPPGRPGRCRGPCPARRSRPRPPSRRARQSGRRRAGVPLPPQSLPLRG